MFDIGFLEILVVLIVALLVIGPERMPEVARKIGSFVGRTRRFIDSVKQDGEFQQAVNEIKEAVDFEEQKKELTSLSQEIQQDLQSTTHDIEPLDFSELESPFGSSTSEPSQFRKAPAMPEPPQPKQTQTSAVSQAAQTDRSHSQQANPVQPANGEQKIERTVEHAVEYTAVQTEQATAAKIDTPIREPIVEKTT